MPSFSAKLKNLSDNPAKAAYTPPDAVLSPAKDSRAWEPSPLVFG